MAQLSRPQSEHTDNFPTADSGPYAGDLWSELFQLLFTGDQQATQGPLIRVWNELTVTNPAGVTIRVDTGAGWTNGHLLVSDANAPSPTDFTPSAPAVSRTDRVVMVENNTNATYNTNLEFPTNLADYNATASIEPYAARLAILTGVDGGAMRPLVQTTATYMVELARYDISNVPAVSNLADYRDFCYFSSTIGTRQFFVPTSFGRNYTDATNIYETVTVTGTHGIELPDNKLATSLGRFVVPNDYKQDLNIRTIVMGVTVTGNVYGETMTMYGACGEAYTKHTNTSGYAAVAIGTAFYRYCIQRVDLTSETIGDIVQCIFNRDSLHINDTVPGVVLCLGFLVEYKALS